MVQVSNKDASVHMGITHREEATGETPSLGRPKNTSPRDPRQAEENGWKDLLVN